MGPGYGKWGFLAREMLDWNPGRLEPETWRVRIDAVEVFAYDSPVLKWVYDSVRHADVLDVCDEISEYDLVIMSDVIEHLPKTEALELLRSLLARNRNVIVSTPVEFFTQEIADNPHERHVSHWAASDFEEFVYDLDVAGGAALVVLLAGRGATIPTRWQRNVNRGLDRIPYLNRRGGLRRAVKHSVARRVRRSSLSRGE